MCGTVYGTYRHHMYIHVFLAMKFRGSQSKRDSVALVGNQFDPTAMR